MFKFTGRLKSFYLKTNEFRKDLDASLKREVRNAGAEWVRAVYNKVPVYTGTARGTLVPVGRVVDVTIPISPVAFKRGRGPTFGESQSSFNFYHAGNVYGFRFDQNLWYYILNDLNVTFIKSSPWQSMKAGEEAFNHYMSTVASKLPQLKDYSTTIENG